MGKIFNGGEIEEVDEVDGREGVGCDGSNGGEIDGSLISFLTASDGFSGLLYTGRVEEVGMESLFFFNEILTDGIFGRGSEVV